MSRQNVSDKNEKSLAEIVIIVLMIAILMASFIYYFFKQENQLIKVGFNTLAQNFSTKITTVRAQWFMDKQPNIIYLMSSGKAHKMHVNTYGWVDSTLTDSACAGIWELVISEPLNLMNMEITATEVKVMDESKGRVCKYSLPSGEYFEYNTNDGKVSRGSQVYSPTQ